MPKTSKLNPTQSLKRINLDKTNNRIIAITAVSSFVVMFCLVGSYSLLGQLTYQNKVISQKKAAVSQLKKNLKARDDLVKSFNDFANSPTNFLGGSASGAGPKDGNNAKLVLDALPSKYDFPALISSMEKITTDQKVLLEGLTGTDEVIGQAAVKSGDATPIEMPIQIKTLSDYEGAIRVMDALDHSIRPIQVRSMVLTGSSEGRVNLDLKVATYYQPPKELTLKTKVVSSKGTK